MENKNKCFASLLDDEDEAINGYIEAKKVFKDDKTTCAVFDSIIEEEKKHIKMIKELKAKTATKLKESFNIDRNALQAQIEAGLDNAATFGATDLKINDKLPMITTLSGGVSKVSLWDQHKQSAGEYNYPEEFDLLCANVEWLLDNPDNSVCCECKKQLSGAGEWKPFAGNYCADCAKKENSIDTDTDWWN